MDITLIAHTGLTGKFGQRKIEKWMEHPGGNDYHPADHLAEFAGRACYQSFNRPNPATRANDDYLAHILEVSHESVLEHASATFYVTGVSRSLTHELIRHRHLSYSELSQRFVNMDSDDGTFALVAPSGVDPGDTDMLPAIVNAMKSSVAPLYRAIASTMAGRGKTRKEQRQAARSVLPNMMETRIVVTGNMRAWRDVIKKRYHVAADDEIREFAKIVLGELRSIAPNTFQDMPFEPFGYERKMNRKGVAGDS